MAPNRKHIDNKDIIEILNDYSMEQFANLIDKFPEIMLQRFNISDERTKLTLHNYTVLQYAIYTLNNRLVKLIKKKLNIDAFLNQYREIKDKKYNLQTLIDYLTQYKEDFFNMDILEQQRRWLQVGQIQGTLPLNIVKEFFINKRITVIQENTFKYKSLNYSHISIFPFHIENGKIKQTTACINKDSCCISYKPSIFNSKNKVTAPITIQNIDYFINHLMIVKIEQEGEIKNCLNDHNNILK